MELTIVVQSIAIITFMIIIGAILSRTFPFNEDTRKLFISLIVNVAMPCIILSSIFKVEMNENVFQKILFVLFISIIVNVAGIALGWILAITFHKNSNRTRELALMSGLGNTGFIGIPLCAVLLGPEGALYAAIFDAGVDITIWTVGTFMLQKKNTFSFQTIKSMINIPIMAIIIGLLLSYLQLRPPTIAVNLIDQLAALAAPLAMFYIGILVMTVRGAKMKETQNTLWLPISVKLIILPLIVAFMINFIATDATMIQVVLIQSMMPTITMASILFAKYSADEEMGAITTVISTMVALITIPLMIYIVNMFF